MESGSKGLSRSGSTTPDGFWRARQRQARNNKQHGGRGRILLCRKIGRDLRSRSAVGARSRFPFDSRDSWNTSSFVVHRKPSARINFHGPPLRRSCRSQASTLSLMCIAERPRVRVRSKNTASSYPVASTTSLAFDLASTLYNDLIRKSTRRLRTSTYPALRRVGLHQHLNLCRLPTTSRTAIVCRSIRYKQA